jgi:lipoprotein-releasing system ATP-binding protein
MIQVENISKFYGNLQVLKGISVRIETREVVSVVGPSGAGKTTLLQIIGSLSKPSSGKVLVNGIDIHALPDNEMARFRNRNIGFVFQFHQLLPEFTALENVCIPAFIRGVGKKEAEEKARGLLKYLNLLNRMDHKPMALSGGEQQRVAVARALINDPQLILADEPSGNLDTKSKEELHKLFFSLRDEFDMTVVIITHHEELAKMADRELLVQDGVLVQGVDL